MEDFENLESLDELNKKTVQQENDFDQDLESSDIAEDEAKKPKLQGVKVPRKPRRNKIVIPLSATPLEVFMLEKEFHMGELAAITKLSQEELLGIIRGDMPTEHQRNRIRLTTGVRL